MTVWELIKALVSYDPDTPIVITGYDVELPSDISQVFLDHNVQTLGSRHSEAVIIE